MYLLKLESWKIEVCAQKDCITPKLTVLGVAEERLWGFRQHQRQLLRIMGRKLRYHLGDLNTAPCAPDAAEKGYVINNCCYCILVTFCWCSKTAAIANHTAKIYFPGHVLLMLLEEKEPIRCSCTSESIVSNTVPEMNLLRIFYEKHKKLDSPFLPTLLPNVRLSLESVLA